MSAVWGVACWCVSEYSMYSPWCGSAAFCSVLVRGLLKAGLLS